MDNLNLIDQIYELEASCAALVAEARERARAMEVHAKKEAEKAYALASSEIYEAKKNAAKQSNRDSLEKLDQERIDFQSEVAEQLQGARVHKALAVAALVERTLG